MLIEAIYELNRKNPNKSEILIQGYGRMGLDATKKAAIKRLEEAIGFIKKEDTPLAWRNANHMIYQAGVIEAMMNAIVEANKEIEDMEMDNKEGR